MSRTTLGMEDPCIPGPAASRERLVGASAEPAPLREDAAQLLIDADAFLQLGLIGRAIEHLSRAVRADPSLLSLRTQLVTLYVRQGQHANAIAQLWSLVVACADPQRVVRYLRYILRLNDKDKVAARRLNDLLTQNPVGSASSSDDGLLTPRPVEMVRSKLRERLLKTRPPTDLVRTQSIPHSDSLRHLDALALKESAATPFCPEQVAVRVHESVLEDGELGQELAVVDECLGKQQRDDALQRLQALTLRYPQSQRVRSRLARLKNRKQTSLTEFEAADTFDALQPVFVGLHARSTLPTRIEHTETALTEPELVTEETLSALDGGREGPATMEILEGDIQEELIVSHAVASPQRRSSSQPRRLPAAKTAPTADAAQALKVGSTLRSFGQLSQALLMFEKALPCEIYGARAALHAGVCQRELSRPDDAIRTFLFGINRPAATEDDLSELFYQLGLTYESMENAGEAILYYRFALGMKGVFRDAAARIGALSKSS